MRRLTVFLVVAALATVAAAQAKSPPKLTGVGKVILIAPGTTGAGAIPTFRWQAYPKTFVYRFNLLDAKGRPVWSWQGNGRSVLLGNIKGRVPKEGGPVVTAGSHWSVSGLNKQGHVIAFSGLRPVSP